jgi:hypothetical protein
VSVGCDASAVGSDLLPVYLCKAQVSVFSVIALLLQDNTTSFEE